MATFLSPLSIPESRELIRFLRVQADKAKNAASSLMYPDCIPVWAMWSEFKGLGWDALTQFYQAKGPMEEFMILSKHVTESE